MDQVGLKLRLEGLWWCFTAVAVIAVLLPVWMCTRDYPFYTANALYIIIAITFSRYTFLLRQTFLAPLFWPKLVIMALAAIVVFILITSLGDFSNYLDEKGLQTIVDHLPVKQQFGVMRYIKGEMVFFGVASIGSAIILPLRMLISVWRMRNTGQV
jgi:hypothetical protein